MGINNSLDSGGYKITEKGILYATVPSFSIPTSNKIVEPTQGNNIYSNSLMNNLLPNTKYYVKAYAINQIGIGFGNLDSFTTKAPVPTITSSIATHNFGNLVYNTIPSKLRYTLRAYNMHLGNDTITISVTAPYLISLNDSTGFVDSVLKIPVIATGATITMPIYVQFPTNLFGNFCGFITHTANGIVNTDTINICGSIIQLPTKASNWGTEFWTGFGSIERMSRTQTSLDLNYGLNLKITASQQDAIVMIDVPLFTPAQKAAVGFPRIISIPANTTISSDSFPVGSLTDVYNTLELPDTRLYFTGISNRAIQILSTNGVPITVVEHIFSSNNSAAASMLNPVNSWGDKYIVQSFSGKSNNTLPSSFFFIIPKEDNTVVSFTPSNDIVDSSTATIFKDNHVPANVKYAQGNTYTITLNKGQVFNAMGLLQGTGTATLGVDLSNTVIQSIDKTKKIAVFSGNSRCLIDTTPGATLVTSGSDNLFQQLMPTMLWGKKYYTLPTKTMEYNHYRIYVNDTATQVKVNGNIINKSSIIGGAFYHFSGNKMYTIEGNLPISVIQFIVSGNTANTSIGNNGTGDPEMIVLTPVELYTNNTSFSTLTFKTTSVTNGSAIVNLIIKKAGISNLLINGLPSGGALVDTGINSFTYTINPYASSNLISLASAFKSYPNDTSYSYARLKLNYPATYNFTSDSSFSAIVYGVASGESYGFNGGYSYNIPIEIDSSFTLQGRIINPLFKPIKNVVVALKGFNTTTTTTDVNAAYKFDSLKMDNYVISPTKNNDVKKNNGLSSIDVILVTNHILNKTKFNSPYKLIAADVNNNKSISNIDVIFMKRLILGIDTAFLGNRLWAFVDSAYSFTDSTNPFPYKDSISLLSLKTSKLNQSFVGVKLGDVNYDWNATLAKGKSTDNIALFMENVLNPISNSVQRISFKVKNFKDLTALQYTLNFNNKKYNFIGIENNKLGIEYNDKKATNNGSISFLWADAKGEEKSLEDGSEIFTLVLKIKSSLIDDQMVKYNGAVSIDNGLELTNDITEIEAWDKNNLQHNIILIKKGMVTNNLPLKVSENWSVSPNPSNGNIVVSLYSNLNKEIVFELSNAVGKSIYTQSFQAKKGMNNIQLNLNKNTKLPSGIYLIKVTGLEKEMMKQIVITNL